MKRRARAHRMASPLLEKWWSGVFTSAANEAEFDLSKNGGGDSSDYDDAENSTNQSNNDEK